MKIEYAVVKFCALYVSRISYSVLKKTPHAILSALYFTLYVHIQYCGMQKIHLFENRSHVEVSLPVHFSLAQKPNKIKVIANFSMPDDVILYGILTQHVYLLSNHKSNKVISILFSCLL